MHFYKQSQTHHFHTLGKNTQQLEVTHRIQRVQTVNYGSTVLSLCTNNKS